MYIYLSIYLYIFLYHIYLSKYIYIILREKYFPCIAWATRYAETQRYADTHTAVYGHIQLYADTHTVACGHIVVMRTRIVIYADTCSGTK
jgi:hypothetical protein